MEKVTRNVVKNCLENEWDKHIDQLMRLSPAEKEKFLQEQGFGTIADFLVHIAGWWKECMRIIILVQKEPIYTPLEVNVDEYNKKVIEENSGNSDDETIRIFNDTKSEIKEVIKKLPDSAFENETINTYLYWCITNHVIEHKIS